MQKNRQLSDRQAVITNAGELPARKLIHAVGPVWKGASNEAELLNQAYMHSLKLANENQLRHIAFPSISTGAYQYPVREAAKIAYTAFKAFAEVPNKPSIKRITMVLFSRDIHNVYQDELFALFPEEV